MVCKSTLLVVLIWCCVVQDVYSTGELFNVLKKGVQKTKCKLHQIGSKIVQHDHKHGDPCEPEEFGDHHYGGEGLEDSQQGYGGGISVNEPQHLNGHSYGSREKYNQQDGSSNFNGGQSHGESGFNTGYHGPRRHGNQHSFGGQNPNGFEQGGFLNGQNEEFSGQSYGQHTLRQPERRDGPFNRQNGGFSIQLPGQGYGHDQGQPSGGQFTGDFVNKQNEGFSGQSNGQGYSTQGQGQTNGQLSGQNYNIDGQRQQSSGGSLNRPNEGFSGQTRGSGQPDSGKYSGGFSGQLAGQGQPNEATFTGNSLNKQNKVFTGKTSGPNIGTHGQEQINGGQLSAGSFNRQNEGFTEQLFGQNYGTQGQRQPSGSGSLNKHNEGFSGQSDEHGQTSGQTSNKQTLGQPTGQNFNTYSQGQMSEHLVSGSVNGHLTNSGGTKQHGEHSGGLHNNGISGPNESVNLKKDKDSVSTNGDGQNSILGSVGENIGNTKPSISTESQQNQGQYQGGLNLDNNQALNREPSDGNLYVKAEKKTNNLSGNEIIFAADSGETFAAGGYGGSGISSSTEAGIDIRVGDAPSTTSQLVGTYATVPPEGGKHLGSVKCNGKGATQTKHGCMIDIDS